MSTVFKIYQDYNVLVFPVNKGKVGLHRRFDRTARASVSVNLWTIFSVFGLYSGRVLICIFESRPSFSIIA